MFRLLAAALIALALNLPAIAAQDQPHDADEPAAETIQPKPVRIEADQIQSKDNDFTFIGNVSVIRSATELNCNRMDGKLEDVEVIDPETKQKTRRKTIASLVACGNVRFFDKASGRRATCERAEYDIHQERIVMTGTPDRLPRIWDGETITEAAEIIFLLKEDRIIWKGKPKFIFPDVPVTRDRSKPNKDKPGPPDDTPK